MYRCFFIILVMSLHCYSGVYAQPSNAIKVAVSILPQKYLLEQIAGERVQVSVMVGQGQSHVTYEPTAKQVVDINNSAMYFRIGVPFESVWIKNLKALNKKLDVIECCTESSQNSTVDSGTAHHAIDPHIWMSPVHAKLIVEIIETTLSKHDPEYAMIYRENAAALIRELDILDNEIRGNLEQINTRYFIVSHPSWGHFADSYNLKQVSLEQHGSEIRAKKLAELIELARAEKIHTVYAQKQFNTAAIHFLAKEIGASVVEFDPMQENYLENLRMMSLTIIQGMK